MRNFKRRQGDSNAEKAEFNFRIRNPRVIGLLFLFGTSTISYYLAWWSFTRGVDLIFEVILKFVIYLSVILWLSSAWYLRELALGTDDDTREFQKRLVKFALCIVLVFILIEIPTWLTVLGSH